VTLQPDQQPSPEQIIHAVNGELRIFQEGQRVGITLPTKHRPLFAAAIKQGYLKHQREDRWVVEAFSWWCDARGIPCVRFAVESEYLEMVSTESAMVKSDPYVRMYFNVATAGRVFTKTGMVAIVKFLLDHLWDIALSPWEISAGVLPFSLAHPLLAPVWGIYNTREMTSEHADGSMPRSARDPRNPSGSQSVH
jgi:hypothetical protein